MRPRCRRRPACRSMTSIRWCLGSIRACARGDLNDAGASRSRSFGRSRRRADGRQAGRGAGKHHRRARFAAPGQSRGGSSVGSGGARSGGGARHDRRAGGAHLRRPDSNAARSLGAARRYCQSLAPRFGSPDRQEGRWRHDRRRDDGGGRDGRDRDFRDRRNRRRASRRRNQFRYLRRSARIGAQQGRGRVGRGQVDSRLTENAGDAGNARRAGLGLSQRRVPGVLCAR